MPTTIKKWGNSLAIRLPRQLTERFKLREGSLVKIVPEARNILIRPVNNRRLNLKELVAKISETNRHAEISWGGPRGKEVW